LVILEERLHEFGYSYVGSNSLYNLTWIEIFRLVDASLLKEDDQIGVRQGDLDKFERYNEKLKARNG
jgi:hypothetical protein